MTRRPVADPVYTQRDPFETLLLGLSVLASVPLLRGDAGSALLERELDNATVIAWGLALLIGSVLALAGSYWHGHAYAALVVERGGLVLVGGAAAVYALVVLATVDDRGGVAYLTCVQAAYALACGWRCKQITSRLQWIRAMVGNYDDAVNHGSS